MFNPNNVDGQVTIFDVIMLQQPLFIVNQRPTMVHGLNMFKITIKLMQNSPKILPARILLGVFFPFKNFIPADQHNIFRWLSPGYLGAQIELGTQGRWLGSIVPWGTVSENHEGRAAGF